MHLLESKVIQSKFEKEIFIDQSSSIELKIFQFPEKNVPYFEFVVGLELLRIRENEYYGAEKRYFGIRFTEDMHSLIIFEPDKHSIFAARNEQENQVVTELINYVLTSPVFKHVVKTMINHLKHQNEVCEKETREVNAKEVLLEMLLNVQIENLKFTIKH